MTNNVTKTRWFSPVPVVPGRPVVVVGVAPVVPDTELISTKHVQCGKNIRDHVEDWTDIIWQTEVDVNWGEVS